MIIKNCPFCGSEGKLIQASTGMNYDGIIQHTYKVKCSSNKCGAETRTCASKIYQNTEGVVHIDANGAIDAINLWNKRGEEDYTDDFELC